MNDEYRLENMARLTEELISERDALLAAAKEKEKEIAEFKSIFTDLDDPDNAQVLWRGKYLIQRVADHDAELKRYYEARDTIKEREKDTEGN